MFNLRLRRWPNIEKTLCECIVLTGAPRVAGGGGGGVGWYSGYPFNP